MSQIKVASDEGEKVKNQKQEFQLIIAFKGRVQILFDGKTIMDNINSNLSFYSGVKVLEGYTKGYNPYTFPGPNGQNWAQYYVTPNVSYEYFKYENIK